MAERAYIDSNVFFYSVIMDTKYGNACSGILQKIMTENINGIISTLVVVEVANAMRKYGLEKDAKRTGIGIMSLPLNIVPLSEQIVHRALAISQDTGVSPYDSVHLATMEAMDIKKIFSADRGFDVYSRIARLDPLDCL